MTSLEALLVLMGNSNCKTTGNAMEIVKSGKKLGKLL